MSAIDLHARASKDFEAKLAETKAVLQRAAAEFAPITQASSLGAEDVVITHLINSLELDIPVFVLDTGMLHKETLDLLERTKASLARTRQRVPARSTNRSSTSSAAKARTPCTGAWTCARPAATSARWSRWSGRWPASAPGSPACAASSRARAPRCRCSTPATRPRRAA